MAENQIDVEQQTPLLMNECRQVDSDPDSSFRGLLRPSLEVELRKRNRAAGVPREV